MDSFYTSFESTASTGPTEAEYEQLRAETVKYYNGFFAEQFSSNPGIDFVSLEFNLDFTLEGAAAGIPETRFNIYMEYSEAVFQFTPSPSNPNEAFLFESMRNGVTTTYILDTVRTLTGTPFAEVTEAFSARPSL